MTQGPTPRPVQEKTDRERRVLAHERILQSLIASLSRAEPGFLDHLSKAFVEPMEKARKAQDYTASDDYSEAFTCALPERPERSAAPRATAQDSGADRRKR